MSNSTIERLIFTQVDFPSFLEQETGRKMTKVCEGKYKCLCPFPSHRDSKPSFCIDYKDGGWKWHCFGGCGGGSIIQFYIKYFQVSKSEAIEALRERFEISDDPRSVIQSMEKSSSERPDRRDLESYFTRMAIACKNLLRDYPEDRDVVKFVKSIYEKSNNYLEAGNLEEMRYLFEDVQSFASGEKI